MCGRGAKARGRIVGGRGGEGGRRGGGRGVEGAAGVGVSQEMLAPREQVHVSGAEPTSSQKVMLYEDAARPAAPGWPDDDRCTVFLRNLPVRCRQEEVIRTLAELGWGGDIVSVSLPLRPAKPGRAHHNRGYGFVYLNSPLAARAFLDAMVNGFCISARTSSKVVLVEHIRGSGSQERPISDVTGVGTGACSGSNFNAQTTSIADWMSQSRLANPTTVQWLRL